MTLPKKKVEKNKQKSSNLIGVFHFILKKIVYNIDHTREHGRKYGNTNFNNQDK